MEKQIKVRQVVSYKGHSLSANGGVSLRLKAGYSELVHTIEIMQLLNDDILIKAKVPGNKPMRLGTFRIKNISIDGDGESVIKFDGLSDYVELDNLASLPLQSDDVNEFVIMSEALVEIEEE